MNRRDFLISSIAASVAVPESAVAQAGVETGQEVSKAAPAARQPEVAVLLVDTDRVMGSIEKRIYGHVLEHINHSVEIQTPFRSDDCRIMFFQHIPA